MVTLRSDFAYEISAIHKACSLSNQRSLNKELHHEDRPFHQ